MIRKAAFIIVLIVLGMLTGCNTIKNPNADAPPSAPAQTEPAKPAETASPAQTKKDSTQTPSLEDQEIADRMMNVEALDFTLEKADGTKVTLSELKGKPVVLNFWATWCPYCVGEFGYFTQAQKEFPGIIFYAVDTDEKTDLSVKANREEMEKFAKDEGFELPILYDVGSQVAYGQYGFRGLPATLLIDSKGNIRWFMPGAFSGYDQLEKYLNALLKADA